MSALDKFLLWVLGGFMVIFLSLCSSFVMPDGPKEQKLDCTCKEK